MTLISVDLPQPDSPAMPSTSSSRIVSDTRSSACTGPAGVKYAAETSWTRITPATRPRRAEVRSAWPEARRNSVMNSVMIAITGVRIHHHRPASSAWYWSAQ